MRPLLPLGKLRGDAELLPFDFIAPMGFDTGLNKVNNLVKGFNSNDIIAPPIMNPVNSQFFSLKASGCKDEPQTHIIVRRPALPSTLSMCPARGNFRHQPKGLASLPQKPTNLPIMPLASSFNGFQNNKLGMVK
jgi:hypothetical protein